MSREAGSISRLVRAGDERLWCSVDDGVPMSRVTHYTTTTNLSMSSRPQRASAIWPPCSIHSRTPNTPPCPLLPRISTSRYRHILVSLPPDMAYLMTVPQDNFHLLSTSLRPSGMVSLSLIRSSSQVKGHAIIPKGRTVVLRGSIVTFKARTVMVHGVPTLSLVLGSACNIMSESLNNLVMIVCDTSFPADLS